VSRHSDLDLAFTSAVALAAAVRAGELSPVELVRNSLARIEEINGALNAFCFVYAEESLAQARLAERQLRSGMVLGPLHGIPFALKDFTPTSGKRTTCGSLLFEHWVPHDDPVLVERLLQAGAILIGKTTTSELASSTWVETALWGITRNPWNPQRTCGGSSGGSAVAVATGCVSFAEGSDAGGSVRIPAALCGCVGLKPSFGRIPFDILPTNLGMLWHFGSLTRSIDDAALFLSVAQGPDERDPLSLPQRLDIPTPIAHSVDGLRIALSLDLGFYAPSPGVERNTREVARLLGDVGAHVEEVAVPWRSDLADCLVRSIAVEMAALHETQLARFPGQVSRVVRSLIDMARQLDAVQVKQLEVVRMRAWEQFRPLLQQYDALICPTMAIAAPPVGQSEFDYEGFDAEGRFRGIEMTWPFNLLGWLPVLSVPSGLCEAGLPTAVQIVGRRHDELTVLRIGAAVERARPWTYPRI
jgi:Asp-tRNA(Asn)/Glu-tRNA(Gln) amidotransferase A subunit family amidase